VNLRSSKAAGRLRRGFTVAATASEGLNRVRVDMGDTALYIEVTDLHPENVADFGAERDIAAVKPDMTQVIQAIKVFSGRLGESLRESHATRCAVEFGCEIGLETGQLVAVLGKASAKTTLKITLEWEQPRQ
jgi:hypothetical protein